MLQRDFNEVVIKRIHNIWIYSPYKLPIPLFFFFFPKSWLAANFSVHLISILQARRQLSRLLSGQHKQAEKIGYAAGWSCRSSDTLQEVDCAELNPSFLFGTYILAGDKMVLIFCSKKGGFFARFRLEVLHQLKKGINRTFHHGWSVMDTKAEAFLNYFFDLAFPLPHSFFF